MSPFDRDVLAERTMAVERHLRRVADRLPAAPGEQPATDASDAVVLHLAFRLLQQAEVIEGNLADRLVRPAGFAISLRTRTRRST